MLRRFKSRTIVALTAVAALAIAGAAFAYLSSSGSGSGSGTTSATTTNLVLTGSAPALTKLGDSETFSVYATNAGTSPEKATAISFGTITVPSGCPEATSSNPTDATSNTYTFSAISPNNAEVPAGSTTPVLVGTATVTMNDLSSQSQNSCLSALADGKNFDIALSNT